MNDLLFGDKYTQPNLRQIYRPVFVKGERYSNMINSEQKLNDPDFAALRLSIVDKDTFQIIADDVGVFTKYAEDGNEYRVAWDITSFPDIPAGCYRILLYNTVNDQVKYLSNEIEVLDFNTTWRQRTSYFSFRHSAEIYNFGYDELLNFRIRVRLTTNILNHDNPFDVEEYEEVTSGKSQNPRFDVDEIYTLETEQFDIPAHRAFAIFLAHNDKIINKEFVTVAPGGKYTGEKAPLESPTWNKNVELKIQQFSTINKQ